MMMNQEQQMTGKEALNRFCKNLVSDAKNGKLDPVIGRDDAPDTVTPYQEQPYTNR